MPRQINPTDIAKPRSNYAPAIAHRGSGERLVISGQLGIRVDGSLEPTIEAEMERAFQNVVAVVRAAGMSIADIVLVRVYVTKPGLTALYRTTRDRVLEGHKCASTFLQIAGLAAPEFSVEIEAEAVKE